MPKIIDMSGKKYGSLTVIEIAGNTTSGYAWKCLCDCGKEVVVKGRKLREGLTKSCGCKRVSFISDSNTKHGCSKRSGIERLYSIWKCMKYRCHNKNNKSYKYYGGRGITVCDEWSNSFEQFRDWAMNNGYGDNLTIDRIDVDGNYEPSNCRWVTMAEQNRNKRQK